MKLAVALVGLFFSLNAFAVGPFGPEVSLKTVRGIDQHNCEAPKVARQVYEKTGVNFIEGKASAIWDCKGVTSREAAAKDCPYPQSVNNINNVKCYSNTSDKSQIVCLSRPRIEVVEAVYGDIGKRTEHQVRFDEIIVMNKTTQGFRDIHTTTMDQTGCKVEKTHGEDNIGQMNNGNYDHSFDKCVKMYDAVLAGQDKLCDKEDRSRERIGRVWTQLKKMNFCFVDFPDFVDRYELAKKSGTSELNQNKKKTSE